jgi:rhodanese-related sulfurtransferase
LACAATLLPTGYATNRRALTLTLPPHEATVIEELPPAATGRSAESGIVLVDARDPVSHALGHIPNSINLPVNSPLADYTDFMATFPPGKFTYIVYCQSDSCAWSDEVGKGLKSLGAKNVYVYRGGYKQFRQAHVSDGR